MEWHFRRKEARQPPVRIVIYRAGEKLAHLAEAPSRQEVAGAEEEEEAIRGRTERNKKETRPTAASSLPGRRGRRKLGNRRGK